ncbi:hypothetical protein KIW84_046094, partial [Lathyrus oleraceus]
SKIRLFTYKHFVGTFCREHLLHLQIMTFSDNNKFYTVFIFLYLIILFISTCEVEARLCGRTSNTWRGPCYINLSCNAECTMKEQAIFGTCQHFECFCFFDCSTQ